MLVCSCLEIISLCWFLEKNLRKQILRCKHVCIMDVKT